MDGSYYNNSFSTIIHAKVGYLGQNVKLTVKSTADLNISSMALGIHRI